jgi:protocatechuate 3,4-dioxygenase beta subunit
MPTPATLRTLIRSVSSKITHAPDGAVAAASAVGLSALVLGSLSALHLLEPRVTRAPELPPSPSPWLVERATAVDDGACQLSLRVLDHDGSVVDNAGVEVVRLEDGQVAWRRALRTDDGGVARLIDLEPGYYDLTVDVADRALNGAPTFRCDPTHGGRRAFFDVTVAPVTGVLEGTLVGHRGKALPAATVALWQEDSARSGLAGVVRVRTDVDGRFSARLPKGRYLAQAVAADHVAKKLTLTVDDKTSARVVLPWSPAIRGVVLDELGAPIPGAAVALGGAFDPKAKASAVVADEHGRFALPIQAGQDVVITARGNGRVARAMLGVVDNLDAFQQVQLTATTGRTVSGTVYTTAGTPLAFGAVHYRIRSLGLEGEAPTDGHGRFLLDGMPADADVEVWAAGNASGAWGAQVATPERNELALTFVAAAW